MHASERKETLPLIDRPGRILLSLNWVEFVAIAAPDLAQLESTLMKLHIMFSYARSDDAVDIVVRVGREVQQMNQLAIIELTAAMHAGSSVRNL